MPLENNCVSLWIAPGSAIANAFIYLWRIATNINKILVLDYLIKEWMSWPDWTQTSDSHHQVQQYKCCTFAV